MIEAILNFIFPPHCPLCGAYTEVRGGWCPSCLSAILRPERLPLTAPVQVVLNDAWALSVYRGGTRDLIRRLKYRGQRSGLPYIRTMLDAAQQKPAVTALLASVDLAVPVPLHPKKEKQRGFNQSELIFRDWLQSRGIPMLRGLERVREPVQCTDYRPMNGSIIWRAHLRQRQELRWLVSGYCLWMIS